MKRKQNRFSVRRLYVLGAGASFSASYSSARKTAVAPLDKDFCGRIASLAMQRPKWISQARDRVMDGWRDHLPFTELGLEEAILRQLANVEFIDAIHPRRRGGVVDASEYLNDVAHLITLILRRAKETPAAPYGKFVRRAFPSGKPHDEHRDRIITFNYDDLLDKHLVNRFGVERVYFDKIKRRRADTSRRQIIFEHPLLIKLHGSINWRCDTTEFQKIVKSKGGEQEAHKIDEIWHEESRYPSPSDTISPLIIPPLPIKPITAIKLFQFLWTKAYEYLHEAEEIIVCGYSLPPTDQLATSLFGGFKNAGLRQVTVVDPDPAILGRWRELFLRAGVRKPVWTYHADFGEYVDSMAT